MDGVIRQLGAITLQLAQAVEKALVEMPDFRTLEVAIIRATQEAARQLLVTALEALDRQLMEQRDRRQLKCVNQQPRSLLTRSSGNDGITRSGQAAHGGSCWMKC